MAPFRLRKITALVLASVLLFSTECFAGELTLMQKIKYKEAYIMDPNGHETAVLVNRFTDKIEYSWAVDKWIEAPGHLQHCYENQRNIRSWISKRRKRRSKRKRKLRK